MGVAMAIRDDGGPGRGCQAGPGGARKQLGRRVEGRTSAIENAMAAGMGVGIDKQGSADIIGDIHQKDIIATMEPPDHHVV
ncbi:hypothetical protein, partial [Devosia limi]